MDTLLSFSAFPARETPLTVSDAKTSLLPLYDARSWIPLARESFRTIGGWVLSHILRYPRQTSPGFSTGLADREYCPSGSGNHACAPVALPGNPADRDGPLPPYNENS